MFDALKKKECVYCQHHKTLETKPCGNGDLGARADISGDALVLYSAKIVASGFVKINYCPICGKLLNKAGV